MVPPGYLIRNILNDEMNEEVCVHLNAYNGTICLRLTLVFQNPFCQKFTRNSNSRGALDLPTAHLKLINNNK